MDSVAIGTSRNARFVASALGLLCLAASGAEPGAVPLADLLEISLLGRDLVALDGGGGERSVRLHLGEDVLWRGSRGAVGVVITNERLLAVATRSAGWQEERYQRGEPPPAQALLGDRVALVTTDRRALGFSGSAGSLVEYRLGPHEVLRSFRVGENVAVVVTDRKALGLSPSGGGFFETELHLNERLEGVDTRSALATVTTSRRLLVFRAATGSWSERRRELSEN